METTFKEVCEYAHTVVENAKSNEIIIDVEKDNL